jgi:copper chaperone CopZ
MLNRLIITLVLLIFSSIILQAENTQEIKIKTSAQCEQCKERIEKALNKSKGILKAELDLETKEAIVLFDSEQTDAQKIRQIISKTGYDADDVPANKKAYNKLPQCCKKDGHD